MTTDATYDAVTIGAGLGALTAAALLAAEGRKVCVLERHRGVGGAASSYRVGGLTIEPSLHETADPRDPRDLKHEILDRLGLLDEIAWLKTPALHQIEGGPVGAPFTLPHGVDAAADAIGARFPAAARGARRLLDRMAGVYDTLGALGAARRERSVVKAMGALPGLAPVLLDWRRDLDGALARDLGADEGAKLAIAANLPYYAEDPRKTWWLFFAVAQGGYLASGGVYLKGGSIRLSRGLARAVRRAGGDVFIGRRAVGIELDAAGRAAAVLHRDDKDPAAAPERIAARVVLAAPAPSALATMLPEPRRAAFLARYAGLSPSASLFCAHFGLSEPPQRLGLDAYSTILLPASMSRLSDYAEAGARLAEAPDPNNLPPLTVVNYGVVDAEINAAGKTLVTVVGVDRLANWAGLEPAAEADRRAAWLDAILAALDARCPGFRAATREKAFVTARSMRDFLGTPEGAVYGFAPEPPTRGFWAGPPRAPETAVANLLLASAYAGAGGFTGAMGAGAAAARAAARLLRADV